MAFRLIPREMRFLTTSSPWGNRFRPGAALLEQMLAPDRPIWDKADQIKEVEHRCDNLTHEIIQRLHRTFVTPIDREDIHALATSLDDVIDAIDEAAALVRLYQHRQSGPSARELARIIKASHRPDGHGARGACERRNGVAAAAVEINRLENEADRVHQNAVQRPLRRRDRSHRDHQVEGDLRLARGSHRSLRGRRQRPRRRRRQARLSDRWTLNLLAVVGADRRRPRLRLHQRLPRRRQLDRDRGLDPRADAGQGGASGRRSSISSRRSLRHRRRQDRRRRHGRPLGRDASP